MDTDSRTSPLAVLLTVPGPRWARAAAQAVAVLAVLNVPAALTLDAVAAAVAALVLGGVTLARVLALPGALQAALGAALIVAAAASMRGLYETVTWIDIPVHLAVNGLVAAAVAIVLVRAGALGDPATRAGRVGLALTTTGLGAALGVLWEIAEWAGFTYIDDSVYVYYGDTIGDLAAGTAGSAVAGVLTARWAQRQVAR